MPDPRTPERIAVVIGGASGIGAATARALAADGCTVTVADRDLAGASVVAADLGPEHAGAEVDVADEASVEALLAGGDRCRVGVDLAVVLEILSGSAASSWMLRDRGPRMLEAEPAVASAVDIFVKDLGIVLEAGRGAKAALPLAALAHQLFLSASGRGEGRADDSQVIRTYHRLNGTE